MIGALNKYGSRSPLLPRSNSMGTKTFGIAELNRVFRYLRVQEIHGPSDPDIEDFVLVPRIGDDVDHNPTRKQGNLPVYCPSLTLRVRISAVLQSRLSQSCGTSYSVGERNPFLLGLDLNYT
jgi:hypothetical protein